MEYVITLLAVIFYILIGVGTVTAIRKISLYYDFPKLFGLVWPLVLVMIAFGVMDN